jgi:putative oxidoreductase
MKLLQLNFLPASSDLGLLLLRLWFGGAMAALHGWYKVANYADLAKKFGDPIGIGATPSLILTIFAELVCGVLLALGLFTRLSAAILAFTMGVAFWIAHGGRLTGQGNGEMAFLFLGAYAVVFVTGAGRFSIDAKLGAKV